jgi:hypothetical protein
LLLLLRLLALLLLLLRLLTLLLLLLRLRLLTLLLLLLLLRLLTLLVGNRCGDTVLLDALGFKQGLERGQFLVGCAVCLFDRDQAGAGCSVERIGIAYHGVNGLLYEVLNLQQLVIGYREVIVVEAAPQLLFRGGEAVTAAVRVHDGPWEGE